VLAYDKGVHGSSEILGGDEFYSFFARKKIGEIERAGGVIVSQRDC
jgi:hypothetical protein